MDTRPKTIFCDIDGTLIMHMPPSEAAKGTTPVILNGTLETLRKWDKLGYNIILTTGRKESMRDITVKQLASVGIYYDQLIMGIGGGSRIIINDKKSDNQITAFAISVERNKGLEYYQNDIF